MKGPKALFESENNLVTEMGAWFPGERVVFRGKDLHHDLGDMSWMELYMLGITGRRFSKVELVVLNALWTFTSYPDPRLWNNRVAALAGSSRSTAVLGISAAVSVSEASIYGRRLDVRAIDFLVRAKEADESNGLASFVAKELKATRAIPGYGRPVTKQDERIPAVTRLLNHLGMETGPHFRVAHAVERVLIQGGWRMHMNYAAVCAAIAADIGLTTEEYYHYALFAFVAGMPPCFLVGSRGPEGSFFPIRCADIDYQGAPQRPFR